MGSEAGGHESPLLSETSAAHHQCHRVGGGGRGAERLRRFYGGPFLLLLVSASNFLGREVANCAWFSQVSGLDPCSETNPLLLYEVHSPSPLTSPSYCVPVSGPFRLLFSRTTFFFFVVQQRLLSVGCKVPKAMDYIFFFLSANKCSHKIKRLSLKTPVSEL